jgi:hypothetical protein
MIKPLLKIILLSSVCSSSLLYAAPKDLSAHYSKACKNKSEGQATSFSFKGVLYNGNCVQGDKGLTFQAPKPAEGAAPEADLTTAAATEQTPPPAQDNQTPPPPPESPDGQTPPPPPPESPDGQTVPPVTQ